MRNKIGEEAGKIWQILGAKNEIEITTLPRTLKGKGEIIYQALGWLAHEDKIVYHNKAGKTYISLNEREKQAFMNTNVNVKAEQPIEKRTASKQTIRS